MQSVQRKFALALEQAKQIRALVSDIESHDNVPPASKRLARWAIRYADHLDPLQEYRISELEEQPQTAYYGSVAINR